MGEGADSNNSRLFKPRWNRCAQQGECLIQRREHRVDRMLNHSALSKVEKMRPQFIQLSFRFSARQHSWFQGPIFRCLIQGRLLALPLSVPITALPTGATTPTLVLAHQDQIMAALQRHTTH